MAVLAEQLRLGRTEARLTQVEAAERLGVSQPYLSQLERGQRAVTERLARAAVKLYRLEPTTLPVPSEPPMAGMHRDRLVRQLGTLGYPGYSHLRSGPAVNPAVVLLEAVSEDDLDARVTEALPWVLMRYPELDWDWLLMHAKLRNVQNRLGFLVEVAGELAENRAEELGAKRLKEAEQELERARLAAETTLGREAMPAGERDWLRQHRSPEAARWNVLTRLSADQLSYAQKSGW
jgi:transcriptional regulator with XRE-family HTH domain